MAEVQQIRLEFVGGPFDGHEQDFEAPLNHLASTVALPVNDNVFRMLHGQHRGPAVPTRSVALYELRQALRGWKFFFLETRRAAELNLARWEI